MYFFIMGPFVALLAAIPLTWGWGVGWVHRQFGLWTAITMLTPAVLGGLITWSWWGAITAFFWAGLVRVSFLHHVTWSVNSICHMIGSRPFLARDHSANFWPLAILSM